MFKNLRIILFSKILKPKKSYREAHRHTVSLNEFEATGTEGMVLLKIASMILIKVKIQSKEKVYFFKFLNIYLSSYGQLGNSLLIL